MSFKTSVLIWFSRSRGILPHPQPLSSREGGTKRGEAFVLNRGTQFYVQNNLF